ncbi:MAG: GAF domain-containing protein, partial [Vulcanimicrobiaceae bacterium]
MRLQNTSGHASPRQHARFLFEISELLAKSPSEAELAGELAQAGLTFFCDLCAVHLRDADGKLRLRAVRDKRPRRKKPAAALLNMLDPRREFVQEAMRAGQALLFRRAAGKDSVDESAQRLLLTAGMRSAIVAPILLGSVPVGTLSFLEASGKEPVGTPDCRCTLAVARQVATVLENVQLRERDRRATGRTRLLGDATDKLFSTSDHGEMLQLLLDVMVDEFADLAVVAQLENESLQPIASATSGAEDLPRVGRIAEGTIFG